MVNVDRLDSKLGDVERYLEGLEDKKEATEREFLDDKDLQDIVERRFEKLIQACIDLASHIVSSEGFREPEDYGDLFKILGEEGVLEKQTASKMVEMAGFRNVLAHEYSDIKSKQVYSHLDHLERFREFSREIHRWTSQD